jgi:DNA invertase Pin-like site-specific DNA recombinase
MKNALALKRVSTDGQDLLRQDDDIEELKQEYGLTIVGTLALKGVSGTAMLTHEQVQRILRDLQRPDVHGLCCSAVDRLFRPKQGSDFAIANYFQDARKNLWTKDDGHIELWTDEGWGRFMEAGVTAGKEWRKIRTRTRSGKKKKRLLGRNVSGSATLPRGLCYQRIANAAGKTIDHKWFYDEAELARVTKAYELLFQDRYTMAEIERAVGWTRGRIRTLTNPTWKGIRVGAPMADETGPVEIPLPLDPVVTPEQWNLALKLLLKRRTWSKETADRRHLAVGVLICECGCVFYTHSDVRRGGHDSYFCASKCKGGPGCGALWLRRTVVDEAITSIAESVLTDYRVLAGAFGQLTKTPQADTRVEREKELARLLARRQKWIDQYDADRISKSEFEAKMDAVQAATREIEVQMPVAPALLPDCRVVAADLAGTLASFRTLPFLEQRDTLKRVVRKFQVIDAAIPELTLSGAYLGSLAHTKSAQPSSPW